MRRLVAVALLLATQPAFSRDWEQVVPVGATLPGGATYTGVRVGDTWFVRSDGSVVFANESSSLQRTDVLRWSPSAGIERIAVLEPETSYGGIDGFGIAGSISAIVDGGAAGAVVTRFARYCEASFGNELVIARLGAAGVETALLRPGDAAVGFDPGWLTTGRIEGAVRANESGGVAFPARAAFDDACPIDAFAPLANFIAGPDGQGGLALVAVEGGAAPGMPGGTITDFGFPALAESNHVAFAATIDTGPTGSSNPALLRWNAASGLSTLIRAGQEVDGALVLPPVLSSEYPFAIGPAGHIAVVASANDFDSEGLFVVAPDGSVALRHATGDPAPGLPEHTFTRFVLFDPFLGSSYQLKVNARGEVAFVGGALGADESGFAGLWASDESGALALKLRIGEHLPGRPGVPIASLQLLGFSDDRRLLVRADTNLAESAYLLLDADGMAETLVGVGASFSSVTSLRADRQLRSFAVDHLGTLHASVPEPGEVASAIAAALALATLRRRA